MQKAIPLQVLSRDEAHHMGRTRFYTGRPCKHGHLCERFVTNGGCVQCINRAGRETKFNKDASNAVTFSRPFIFNSSNFPGVSLPLSAEVVAATFEILNEKWIELAIKEALGLLGSRCPHAEGATLFQDIAGHRFYMCYEHLSTGVRAWRPMYPQLWAKDPRVNPAAHKWMVVAQGAQWIAVEGPDSILPPVPAFKS